MDFNGNITSNSVGTAAIQNGAVIPVKRSTAVQGSATRSATAVLTGSTASYLSASITTNGRPTVINWDAIFANRTGSAAVVTIDYYLYIDNVQQNGRTFDIATTGSAWIRQVVSGSTITTLGAGSHTIELRADQPGGSSTADIRDADITAYEL